MSGGNINGLQLPQHSTIGNHSQIKPIKWDALSFNGAASYSIFKEFR